MTRFRAAPIAWLALRQIAMRRALVALIALSLGPFVIAAGALFLLTRIPDFWAALPPISDLFGMFLRVQTLFAVLLTVWAGTGLVADDFRTGALLVYFSRPLTRLDYMVGKLGLLVALDVVILAVPTLALWGLATAFRASALAGGYFLPVAIVVQSLLVATLLSVLAVAAGAVTRSGTMGGALLVGALVLFDAAAAVAPEGARLPLQILSVRRHLLAVEQVLFGVTPDPALLPWAASLLCLVIITVGAGTALWRRLQAVEVV